MRLLFINELGQYKKLETDILPRTGDKVDLFYRPYPTVVNVLLYPKEVELSGYDAVITVV